MPAWIMSHEQKGRGEFHYFIGAVKIVEFRFVAHPVSKKWIVLANYFGNNKYFSSMSEAMKDMHQRLKSPPTEMETNAREDTCSNG